MFNIYFSFACQIVEKCLVSAVIYEKAQIGCGIMKTFTLYLSFVQRKISVFKHLKHFKVEYKVQCRLSTENFIYVLTNIFSYSA